MGPAKCGVPNTLGRKRRGVVWPPSLPVYPCGPVQLSGAASLYQSLSVPWRFEVPCSFLRCLSFHLFCDLLLSRSLSNFIFKAVSLKLLWHHLLGGIWNLVKLQFSFLTSWSSSELSSISFFFPLKWFTFKLLTLWISHQTLESPRSSSKLLFLILYHYLCSVKSDSEKGWGSGGDLLHVPRKWYETVAHIYC